METERLSHISFIKEGEATYISQRYKDQPYLKIEQGETLGMLDVAFQLRKFHKKRELKLQQKLDRARERAEKKFDAGIKDYYDI